MVSILRVIFLLDNRSALANLGCILLIIGGIFSILIGLGAYYLQDEEKYM